MAQAIVRLATLSLCPQFGISLTGGAGLMNYLMGFGDGVCMLGCGAFFTSLSLLVASLGLRPEEVRVLRRQRVLQLGALATLSLGAFAFAGATLETTLALAWMLGAMLGGSCLLQLGWVIRRTAIAGAR